MIARRIRRQDAFREVSPTTLSPFKEFEMMDPSDVIFILLLWLPADRLRSEFSSLV